MSSLESEPFGRESNPWRAAPLAQAQPVLVVDRVAEERRYRPSLIKPLLLYLATCGSTFYVYYEASRHDVWGALMYSGAVMFILTAHELGHFFQSLRYQVPASLPYFIPMPISPIGTMGAVIGMRGHLWDRRALFDIGISGPLAGLVPALFFSTLGIYWSTKVQGQGNLGDPLIMKWMVWLFFGELPPNVDIMLHPLAFAGWVGLLITGLNLIPFGQLDGGHILYALVREKQHAIAQILAPTAMAAMFITGNTTFVFMLLLVMYFGVKHPPTADDEEPLGTGRIVLGWLTLAFLFIGFTPTPFLR